MFKKGGIAWIVWNILFAALFMTLGIVTCVNSGNSDFQNVVILIAGIIVIVDASLRLLTLALTIIASKAEKEISTQVARAAASSSELAIGILLILVSQGQSAYLVVLFQYLAYFIGILLIILGAVAVLFSVVFLIRKVSTMGAKIGGIIIGALLVTGGILVLVYANQEAMLQIFFVLFGILLILIAVAMIFGTIGVAIAVRHGAKLAEEANNASADEPNAADPKAIDAVVEEEKAEPSEEKIEPAEDKAEPTEEPEEKKDAE